MFYPLNLLSKVKVSPLFGSYLKGEPHIFDFSSSNPNTLDYDTADFQAFNEEIFKELADSGQSWGIGRYLEERKNLLRAYPNIIEEKRYYHLGLDIIVPYNTPLYAPLDAEVYAIGKETKLGNYGGYVMLKHEVNDLPFYSFYGHIKTPHLVEIGQQLKAGQEFARIGKESDSGGWFCHTHLQILTQKAVDKGLIDWGYCSPEFFAKVEHYFPSPYYLFRY